MQDEKRGTEKLGTFLSLPLLVCTGSGLQGLMTVKWEHAHLWIAGEAGMFPGVLSSAPPGNQQTPVGQNCREERELISCLNVLLGGGEMLFWESKRGGH